ncbi:MAG: hypothetical protein FE835_13530 [Gammaproteobacteria bacterium]|nr:hypothetical protein [Gammaproteobacteria bacterium]
MKSHSDKGTCINAFQRQDYLDGLQACRDAQDAKRDVQVPLLPSLITTVISFCRSRPASGSLRQSIASSDQTSYPYLKWLNGVSDAYAASPLAQGTTGMLRAAYAYCGLPAFVSLSMAGSECSQYFIGCFDA